MTLRAPIEPPTLIWKRTAASAVADQDFINLVLEHWDNKKSTADIAEFTFEDEAVVYAALCAGREQRKNRA